jgi:phenylpropionate dioxygenase-like ring-hydroxylating dioxygenase large terminal subunit
MRLLLFVRCCAVELGTIVDKPDNSSSSSSAQPRKHYQNTAAAAAAAEGEVFNWAQAWYPLAAVSALNEDAPNAQQMLGLRLVVWWDKVSSSWRCFEDLCPHR